MKVYTEDNKLVIMTVPKLFLLIWLKTLITACIMKMIPLQKRNEVFTEHKIKDQINQLLFNFKHGSDIHEQGKQ